MKDEKETRGKLLISAKEEFLEKGYAKASLRNICKKAGVTTGALYFCFNDKEDLFGSLVKDSLDNLYNIVKLHYDEEVEHIDKGIYESDDYLDHFETLKLVIDYIYENYDVFVLLFLKSQGSKYEKVIDEFIKITEEHFTSVTNQMAKLYNVPKINNYIIHWVAHLQIFSFVELLNHNFSKEEAMKQMNDIVKFLINGWKGFFQGESLNKRV